MSAYIYVGKPTLVVRMQQSNTTGTRVTQTTPPVSVGSQVAQVAVAGRRVVVTPLVSPGTVTVQAQVGEPHMDSCPNVSFMSFMYSSTLSQDPPRSFTLFKALLPKCSLPALIKCHTWVYLAHRERGIRQSRLNLQMGMVFLIMHVALTPTSKKPER